MRSDKLYPVLASGCVLRRLESPFAYRIHEDQLYELDEEAFEFLRKCDGMTPYSEHDAGDEVQKTIEYMLDEGILDLRDAPLQRKIKIEQSPIPSLRYLLFNITDKCNLKCRHCFLGNAGSREIRPELFEKAVSQFEEMGGMKLMISGGEPLIHSGFWDLMDAAASYELRIILLSNGTLIDRIVAKKLSSYVDEVQVSIDGIQGHDMLRGKGTYDKAMSGIFALQSFNIPVSIATMVHRHDILEFEAMQKLFSDLHILSWSVDVPCEAGSLKENPDFILLPEEAAPFLSYGFGAGAHESTGNHTCGSHLCAVSPEGEVSRCGFFENEPAGDVSDLKGAWMRLCKNYLWTLDMLECSDCEVVHDCRGGCRFRAKLHKGMLAPDPIVCHANSILKYL